MLTTPRRKKYPVMNRYKESLGPGLILWYDLSNGKGAWDLVLGMKAYRAGSLIAAARELDI